jgi:hypothetical protein
MRRWQGFILMTLLVLLVGTVSAQSKPDFSGRWSIVRESPEKGGAGSASHVSGAGFNCRTECTIAQDGQTLTISYPADPDGAKRPDVVLNLDGRESMVTEVSNTRRGDFVANASWDGDKLVVTRAMGPITITQTLALDQGRLKVANTFGIKGEVPVTLTYERR